MNLKQTNVWPELILLFLDLKVMREWREKNPDAAEPAPARMQKLKAECKRAKEELQQGPSSVRVEIEEFSKTSGGDHVHLTVDITKNEVDRAIDSTLNECLSVVEEALKVAKSTTKDAFSEAMLDKVSIHKLEYTTLEERLCEMKAKLLWPQYNCASGSCSFEGLRSCM